jgi:putative MFS transporter
VAVIAVPLALEFTPTRLRTLVVGFVTTAMVPIGIMVAAVVAAVLPWRAAFLIGLLPILLVPFILTYVPESPRWLADKGRLREARRVVAWLVERPEDELGLDAPPPTAAGESYGDLWRYRGSVLVTVLAWLGASIAVSGLVLWGPTFLERILDIGADEAALLFLLVALGSFAGRLFFSFVPHRVGRRTCGLLMGFGAVPPLVLAAFSGDTEIAGVPLFLVALIPAAFFVDGGFANLAPYTPEIFPTRLRTHGMGLAWAVSGLGRIIGPLVIALLAGTGDLVEPEATLDALPPSFLFLAGSALLVGAGFLLVRIEPHGRDLETLSAELAEEALHPTGGAAALEQT